MGRIDHARHLRSQGMSILEIADLLKAPVEEVSGWVRDEVLSVKESHLASLNHLIAAQTRSIHLRAKRREYQQEGRERAKEKRPLHLAGCMLYWGEGTKSRSGLSLINSDANMLLLFIKFLRDEMLVSDKDIKINVQCHTTNVEEMQAISAYWLELLHLSSSSLTRIKVKKGNPDRPHKIYKYGFCTINVNGTRLIQHIYGAIQEYAGFDDPSWLF